MKYSFALSVASLVGFATTLVSCGNIPSPEMLTAQTLEEFERLRAHVSSGSNDETMRTEYMRRRLQEKSQALLASYFGGQPGFYHGVASGDPLPDAVILWTRYTPLTATSVVTLELRISPIIPTLPVASHLDPALNPAVRRVNIEVSAAADWVAKVDVTGLPSGTNFVYAFSDGLRVSDVGQTKTAPPLDADPSQLVYAVFSCSHFANGYFHPYDAASTIKDLDFWMHIGDYVVRIRLALLSVVALCIEHLFFFLRLDSHIAPRLYIFVLLVVPSI
jgi:PhoD-like phosphatase, N-terminal domain/PhoD-like phosphatase